VEFCKNRKHSIGTKNDDIPLLPTTGFATVWREICKAGEPEPFGSLRVAPLPNFGLSAPSSAPRPSSLEPEPLPSPGSQLSVGNRSLGASSKLCLFILEKKIKVIK